MKTFLVTGADRGIGESLCIEFKERGEHVIAACLGDPPTLRSRKIQVEPGARPGRPRVGALGALFAALDGRDDSYVPQRTVVSWIIAKAPWYDYERRENSAAEIRKCLAGTVSSVR